MKLVNTTDLKSVPFGLPVQFRQWVLALSENFTNFYFFHTDATFYIGNAKEKNKFKKKKGRIDG